MFGKDQQALFMQMQQSLTESQEKLENLSVSGEAGGGLVRIELNGNRRLKALEINARLQDIETEDLEDFISVALDQALQKVNELNEKEMAERAKLFMPGF